MPRPLYGESPTLRFPWQAQIAGSGLPEILELGHQLRESGLFEEGELAPLRKELKELAVLLAKNLIAQLSAPQAEPGPPPSERERLNKTAGDVRERLRKVERSLPASR